MKEGYIINHYWITKGVFCIVVSNFERENKVHHYGFSINERYVKGISDIGIWRIKYK
jgi:hypothetical membrane protein